MNKEKFVSHEGELQEVTNEDLDCKNCIYKHPDTSTCIMYQQEKPGKILLGGKCSKKKDKAS